MTGTVKLESLRAALVLATLGAVLLHTWISGQVETLLHPMLRPLVLGGGIVVVSLSHWIGRSDTRDILNPAALTPSGDAALPPGTAAAAFEPSWKKRLRGTVRSVSDDFLAVAFFLVLGAAVAAFLNTSVNRAWLLPLAHDKFLGPVAAIFLAQVLSLCSTTDAFIIAALPQFPMAAALAFLVAGPLFDLKLLWVYQALFTRRIVFGIWLRVSAGAIVLAWLYSLVWHRQ